VKERLEAWRRRSGWLLAVTLLLGVNASFFFWYRGSGEKRQEALEARRAALASEVSAAEREAEKSSDQSRRLSQVSQAIEEFYGRRIGSQRATQAEVVDEIHSLLKKAGVAPSQIGYTLEPVAKLPLSRMTATFSFAADYRRLKKLLEAIETGSRWIVVREVSVARNSETPGAVEVHMAIATYFAGETPEPPPTPAAKGVSAASSRRSP
jgi:Tfp pilus assembly protein PilO